jgi:hypothetical protein
VKDVLATRTKSLPKFSPRKRLIRVRGAFADDSLAAGKKNIAIYRLTKDSLTALSDTQFRTEGFLARKDPQRLLRTQIQALVSDSMVICEEFGQWVDSSRRVDLLCLDRDANLVVVELKRTEDGGYMELQG